MIGQAAANAALQSNACFTLFAAQRQPAAMQRSQNTKNATFAPVTKQPGKYKRAQLLTETSKYIELSIYPRQAKNAIRWRNFARPLLICSTANITAMRDLAQLLAFNTSEADRGFGP